MRKNKRMQNFPLKILSVIVGILVWLIVVNVDDPIDKKVISVPISYIQIANEAYIDSNGKMYMLDNSQSTFKVTLKGSRKAISGKGLNDLTVVADLQQAVSLDTVPVMVPLTVVCEGISSTSSTDIEITPKNLSVTIEDKKTQEFVVNVTRGETKPGKGYEVGSLSSSPETVKITGPTSLIDIIDKVSAYISVEGKTENVTKEVELRIVDKNGETFTDAQLSYLNVPKVTATAKLWEVENVNVKAGCKGTPADGYIVESVATIPDNITVTGSTEALESLLDSSNRHTIWLDDVDVTGQKEDFEVKVDITEYLPEGISLTSDLSADVWIRVSVLPDGSKVYNIPTKNILVEDLAEDMQVVFETDKIEVRIQKNDDMKALTEEEIIASISLKDMKEGSYNVPVSFDLPEGYELVQDVTTDIEIAEIEVTESSEGEEE